MIRSALLSCLVLTSPAWAGNWWEEITTQPGSFTPLRPLKARYTFGWSAFTAGNAEADFSRTKEGEYLLKIKGASAGAVRAMWKLDADASSVVRPQTLLPTTVVQHETYADESRTTTVNFTDEAVSRTRVRKPPKEPLKTKQFKFAPVHDLHSALLFIRSQPLKDGDVVRFAVYPAAQPYLAEVTVAGRETIKTAGKKWPAIKLDLKLQEIDKDLALSPHKKFKRASGWLSDDADRILLKVESEIMIGKVWMDLEQVSFRNDSPENSRTAQRTESRKETR